MGFMLFERPTPQKTQMPDVLRSPTDPIQNSNPKLGSQVYGTFHLKWEDKNQRTVDIIKVLRPLKIEAEAFKKHDEDIFGTDKSTKES